MLLFGPLLVLFALITWQIVADGPLTVLDERLSRELVHPDRASNSSPTWAMSRSPYRSC
ncbi:hypothetical protein SHKM778_21250 [Streptomyces sp. KM77-8]|uniref:ABC transporter permease n=1 Tax=Streptomyces haneummycinicus TaxID=3074435 RepID=A0AAT9HE42_9ACTN